MAADGPLTFSPATGFPLGKRSLLLQVESSDQNRSPSRSSTAASGALVHPLVGQNLAATLS